MESNTNNTNKTNNPTDIELVYERPSKDKIHDISLNKEIIDSIVFDYTTVEKLHKLLNNRIKDASPFHILYCYFFGQPKHGKYDVEKSQIIHEALIEL